MGNYNGKSIFYNLIGNTTLGKMIYGDSSYTDGYGVKRNDTDFKDSANGQLVSRIWDTAKSAAKIVATGLASANPITASAAAAPLITGSQAYFATAGLKDAWDRLNKEDKTIEDGVNVGLDVLGVAPLLKQLNGAYKTISTSLQKPVTQKSLTGFSWNKYYNPDTKQWNADLINSDLRSGKQQAVDFLTSDVRNQTFARNNRIFRSKTGYNLPRNDSKINSPVQVKFTSLGNSVGGDYNPKIDEIRINSKNATGYDATLFHELLHRNGYGEGSNIFKFKEFDRPTREAADKFYEDLTRKVMGNSEYSYYLWGDGEMAANSLELGIKNGIMPGTKYPGDIKAKEIFKQLENDPNKGFVMKTMNWNENPKYVWRAITGTLFGAGAPIILNNDKSK